MKPLSDRAELLLGLVCESTRLDANGEVDTIFTPSRYPTFRIYGQRTADGGFRPSGSGDAAILRGFERRGLTKLPPFKPMVDYAYIITDAGIALYNEIRKRREANPPPDPVFDGDE